MPRNNSWETQNYLHGFLKTICFFFSRTFVLTSFCFCVLFFFSREIMKLDGWGYGKDLEEKKEHVQNILHEKR